MLQGAAGCVIQAMHKVCADIHAPVSMLPIQSFEIDRGIIRDQEQQLFGFRSESWSHEIKSRIT